MNYNESKIERWISSSSLILGHMHTSKPWPKQRVNSAKARDVRYLCASGKDLGADEVYLPFLFFAFHRMYGNGAKSYIQRRC